MLACPWGGAGRISCASPAIPPTRAGVRLGGYSLTAGASLRWCDAWSAPPPLWGSCAPSSESWRFGPFPSGSHASVAVFFASLPPLAQAAVVAQSPARAVGSVPHPLGPSGGGLGLGRAVGLLGGAQVGDDGGLWCPPRDLWGGAPVLWVRVALSPLVSWGMGHGVWGGNRGGWGVPVRVMVLSRPAGPPEASRASLAIMNQ